jgi:hypothetical protein
VIEAMAEAFRPEVVAHTIKLMARADHVTLLVFDLDGRKGIRIYSDMPEVFPTTGVKDIPDGPLRDRIFLNGRISAVLGATELADTFWDHALILEVGIDAIVNVPILDSRRVLASVNCIYYDRGAVPSHLISID